MKQVKNPGPRYNPVFAEYVSSVSFQISLTRNMIVKMVGIKTKSWDVFRMAGVADASCMSAGALIRRGLAHAPDPQWPGRLELTEAGEHVYSLLEISGQIQPLEEILTKKELNR